ncbi:DUF1631 domain-containing protein [Methylococcus sp. EFPC2]|uniref:DUF1631 domain-containing protein n=1 Tax=Methylococcus sp. EFPC2 TaxID=2812648 RepID=UPI0019685F09|nr:DUF1631 domain-containing protein [Methylococcus sp. EFPC2]QSA95882.1 DUF1631 domain-containing protein [Methylococcus sp. EFPC2]
MTTTQEQALESDGTLPRYRDVMQVCHDNIVERYTKLFQDLFGHIDDFMLGIAETSGTNAERNHCFEIMHELLVRQADIERKFSSELSRGFANFARGVVEPLRSGEVSRKSDHLSLIDKEDYEITLAWSGVCHAANVRYASELFALNHRLAIVNGGVKLGEYNPALPGSPAQVCDAFRNALDLLDLPIAHKIKIALIAEFGRGVLCEAGTLYADFNDTLIRAGILPHLSLEAIGYRPPSEAAEPAAEPDILDEEHAAPERVSGTREQEARQARSGGEEKESSLDREIFNSIQEILARRHDGAGGAASAAPVQTNIPELLNSLNTLQLKVPPSTRRELADQSLDTVKQAFAEQLARLADVVKEQQVNAADADIIDLVGMLFEFILNDQTLPDSVKALLSHLHTPILKVALLDKKFFFRSKHPARRLLNALTQAGALCNPDENEDQGMFAKMQSVVERILSEFDENTELFNTLLEDFTDFVDHFNRRSKVAEKRTVETAKGRERLREARQAVSQEIVDRTWNRTLPKPAEELLLGPWANLMVLTALRNGEESEEWKQALAVVDRVIQSVEPPAGEAERQKVRANLPDLEQTIRSGLTLIGDPEVNTNALLEQLLRCQQEVLARAVAPRPQAAVKPEPDQPGVEQIELRPPKAIWNDVEVEGPSNRQPLFLRDASPALLAIVEQLRNARLGMAFEFTDSNKRQKLRVKLSWYSPKTSYYIFVNQSGIQAAVKSLRTLAKEMERGESRILPQERKPFMERALQSIHTLLERPESVSSNSPAGLATR